jgi:hypothetical protein
MSYSRVVLEEVASLDPSAIRHDPTEYKITGNTIFMAKEALRSLDEERNAYEEALNYMETLPLESGVKFMALWRNKEWDEIMATYPDYDINTAWPLGYCQRGSQNEQ